MQEAGYDTLSNDLNEMLEDVELEIKSNADKQLEVIDSLLDKTVSKYDEAYSKVQEIIAQTGFVGSELFNKISLAGLSSEEQALLQKIIAGYVQSDIDATNNVQNIVTDPIELPNTSDIEKDIVDPKDKSVSEALLEALKIAVNDIRKENHLDENPIKSNNSTVVLPDGTILTKLSTAGKKVPNYLTANLLDGVNPASDIMENTFDKTMKLVSSVVNNAGNTISCHYDSLLTVNGNVDKNVLPELQDILKQSYQYTTQQMTKDALRAGNKLRR